MKRRIGHIVLTTSVVAAMLGLLPVPSAGAAACHGPTVAVMGAESDPAYIADVVAKLTATCRFSAVTAVDVFGSTPTLPTLLAYDTAIVWTDDAPFNAAALGDVLADYVDAGHRLAVGTFGFSDGNSLNVGRLATDGYMPLTFAPNESYSGGQILVTNISSSPLLAGVTTFSGGFYSYKTLSSLTTGAVQVASWSDIPGTPLVAVKGDIVGLNFFLASGTVLNGLWDPTTDGATLMANALSTGAYPTELTQKAPGSARVGTSVRVSGKLKSPDAACPASQALDVVAGLRTRTVTTDSTGAYSFKVAIKKATKVRVSFSGDAVCAKSSSRAVIRAA
jgi:hypothetical protein